MPDISQRPASSSLTQQEAADTRLGRSVTPMAEDHPGRSGVHAVSHPRESFAIRMLLAEAAEKTLDVQYYIWANDTTGRLLMTGLYEAAERGVRVRLLLDDNGIDGIDDRLAALDDHSNVEIRLFNPFPTRTLKKTGYVYDFFRLNRRMHNKSFTADSTVAVVGGRNVGDDYFGATDGVLKADLDALLVGPVVTDVSDSFDVYWASESSYPVSRLIDQPSVAELNRILEHIASARREESAQRFIEAIRQSDFVDALLSGDPGLLWSEIQIVADDPAKGLGDVKGKQLLIKQLARILQEPERSIVLVSPYFVPAEAGTETFVDMARRGVDVRVLTNAQEATDVLPVHAGYAKRRKALLQAGVSLYEMKLQPGGEDAGKHAGPFGSSASSLHAKTFVVDSERAFIGSFNFDPRSMHLNTELGFVINSPELAEQIETALETGIPDRAYEVKLDEDGSLYWLDQRGDETIRLDSEPNTSIFSRMVVMLLGWLPIEWLL